MLKISNFEIMGWEHAIRGMRNPMNSWDKSDSGTCSGQRCETCKKKEPCTLVYTDNIGSFALGKNDYDLMTKLRNAGTDHRKFMRMITVYLDITAPLYWWKEFDTYKVGTVANSCSTMHKIAEREFTFADFSCEHLLGYDDLNWGDTVPLVTFVALISITKQDGTPYVPNDGDKVRFAMKAKYEDPEPLVVKDIPIDTLTLTLHPEDTKDLSFGKYVYDIQLTKADGTVDTFITKATIKITEEVD